MADQEGEEDQFQADLAKALALSLETHAIENLRREGGVYVNVPQGMYLKTWVQFIDVIDAFALYISHIA